MSENNFTDACNTIKLINISLFVFDPVFFAVYNLTVYSCDTNCIKQLPDKEQIQVLSIEMIVGGL